jgi:hypothetical protein
MRNASEMLLQEELIEAMDEQFSRLKGRQLVWPKQPTVIREVAEGDCLMVCNWNRIGLV